jgi:hypothetical protein
MRLMPTLACMAALGWVAWYIISHCIDMALAVLGVK